MKENNEYWRMAFVAVRRPRNGTCYGLCLEPTMGAKSKETWTHSILASILSKNRDPHTFGHDFHLNVKVKRVLLKQFTKQVKYCNKLKGQKYIIVYYRHFGTQKLVCLWVHLPNYLWTLICYVFEVDLARMTS